MQVRVRVTAGAKKETLNVLSGTRLEIAVTQKPAHGAANARVVELVARFYNVPTSKVRIVRGHSTSSKILEVGER